MGWDKLTIHASTFMAYEYKSKPISATGFALHSKWIEAQKMISVTSCIV